jgi:hypothetical protein
MKNKFKWYGNSQSEKHFTIFEGVELETEENPPKFTNENLYIQIPKSKINKINHVRLFLKHKDKTCQIYNPGSRRIGFLIQKIKDLKLQVFEVFKKVIELLTEVSFDSRKLCMNFQIHKNFVMEDFLKEIEFDKFKHLTMKDTTNLLPVSTKIPQVSPNTERIMTKSNVARKKTGIVLTSLKESLHSPDSSTILVISDEDEDSEDLNETTELEKTKKLRFRSKISRNFFTFHKGIELQSIGSEIKIENLCILFRKSLPIEKVDYLKIGVKFKETFAIVHDISEFKESLIELIQKNENILNQKLFPIVISLLKIYSSSIFYRNSRRPHRNVTDKEFNKEIGLEMEKENSPLSVKRTILSKETLLSSEDFSDSEYSETDEEISDSYESKTHKQNPSDFILILINGSHFSVNKEELKKYSFHSSLSIVSLNSTPMQLIYNENALEIIFKIINQESIPKLNLSNDDLIHIFMFIELNKPLQTNRELNDFLIKTLKHSFNENGETSFQKLVTRVYQNTTQLGFAQKLMIQLMSLQIGKKRKRKSLEASKISK